MATSIQITKASLRNRVVVDVEVWMDDPEDHDFSPRARLEGNTLNIENDGGKPSSNFELDSEQVITAERDRMIELRVKFNVHGMHGVLIQKNPMTMTGPKSKKLAVPSWKTVLPLSM